MQFEYVPRIHQVENWCPMQKSLSIRPLKGRPGQEGSILRSYHRSRLATTWLSSYAKNEPLSVLHIHPSSLLLPLPSAFPSLLPLIVFCECSPVLLPSPQNNTTEVLPRLGPHWLGFPRIQHCRRQISAPINYPKLRYSATETTEGANAMMTLYYISCLSNHNSPGIETISIWHSVLFSMSTVINTQTLLNTDHQMNFYAQMIKLLHIPLSSYKHSPSNVRMSPKHWSFFFSQRHSKCYHYNHD